MATRIKRYEERAEKLDDLLARIEREMGADALIETRLFRRGGFLGLGGQRLVEVVATLELNGTALEKSSEVAPQAAKPRTNPEPRRKAVATQPVSGQPTPNQTPSPATRPTKPPGAKAPTVQAAPQRIDLSADASLEMTVSETKARPAEISRPADSPEGTKAQAPPPPVPSPPSPPAKPNKDIAELKGTINELKDYVLKLMDVQRKPLAESDPANPAGGKPDPAQGTIQPASLDPAVGITDAQRQAYDELISWDISPRDALELLNTALGKQGEQSPLTREALLAEITSDICRNILLSNGIKLDKAPPAKVIALVGTTGVGKTTTIAKLAANFAFNQGKRVSLISLDNYRIAAAEQLRTYSDIIGLSFDVVFNRDEFDKVLSERLHNDLVLVDTAGRSPHNTKQIFELKDVFSTHPPDEVHLVVSANVKAHDLSVILDNFKPLGYDHVIVSKLDETRSLGGIFNINQLCQLPISYFTTGQSVPEDIRIASLKFIQTWIEQGKAT